MIGIFVAPRRRKHKVGTAGQPDSVAPTLTALTLDQASWQFDFSSDEGGALHWLVDGTASYIDANALILAKAAGQASGSALAMTGSNAGELASIGLPAGDWFLHVAVLDTAGNASNVLSTNFAFISGNLELDADPLEWNGDQLIFNAA